jgi:hypothetical protein
MPILTIPLRTVDLGNGHYMQTTAEVNTDQQVASFNEVMTCTNKLEGFTGGVLLTYLDANNKVIGNSGVQQNGINQAPLFGANHRTITWNGSAPANTASLVLSQFWDPHNRLGNILWNIGEAFLAFAETAVEVSVGDPVNNALSQQWCNENPDFCGVMDAFGVIAGIGIVVLIAIGVAA